MKNHKICCTCNKELHKSFFPKNKNGKLGVHSKCKSCFKIYRENNKRTNSEITEKFCKKCKTKKQISKFQKRSGFKDGYDCSCKECRRSVKNYNTKKCRYCDTSYEVDSYKSVKEKFKQCDNCKKERNNSYRKEYVKKNKSKSAIRNITYQSFIRALKGQYIKSEKTEELLGCSLQKAIRHIERTFSEGMSWNNHGRCSEGKCDGVWHIDHIIPLDSAKTEEELKELCHYTNLQALWAKENLNKKNKIL